MRNGQEIVKGQLPDPRRGTKVYNGKQSGRVGKYQEKKTSLGGSQVVDR